MLLRDESTKDNTEGPDFIKDVRDNKITGMFSYFLCNSKTCVLGMRIQYS